MSNTPTPAKCYTFEQLLTDNTIKKIEIPRIQRDYAQGRTDDRVTRIREKFVSALNTALTEEQNLTLDFIYGNIDKKGILTLLDGQQRLTTLFLLHWYFAQTETEIDLLKKFSYEIRPSTRDFCAKLLTEPFNSTDTDKYLSEKIKDQSWFPLSWSKDPSITSMLTMLDEIHKQFKETTISWETLSNITFYFLPLEDMGLTDDLYIKMNSRGKPLTDFEHFKAELDKQLSKLDNAQELANRIRLKFDTTWTDLLWEYRNSDTETENDNIVDDEFLRYIHFICDVIYYQNETDSHKQWNDFDLLKIFFTCNDENDKEKIKQNFETLEKYFDCWCENNLNKIKVLNNNLENSPFKTPNDFLSSFINKKIITTVGKDIFQNCLAKYTTPQFDLKQFIFLYAVTYYLQQVDTIEYDKFVRRIRIINNLIQNSSNEITKKRIKNILKHVEEILKEGEVKEKDNTFNKYQLREEKQKIELLKLLPEYTDVEDHKLQYTDALFELEDHKLLYGQISILFDFEHIENITNNCIKTAYKFISLFKCDFDKIDCALMSIGNYSQRIKEEYGWRWRYQFATKTDPSWKAWKELFHQNDINSKSDDDNPESDFAKTRKILLTLLGEINNTEKTEIEPLLEQKKDDFINKYHTDKLYPFEYYYIKYDTFRQGNGNFHKYDGSEYAYHVFTGSNAKTTYNPFLREACGELFNKYKAFNFGQRRLQFATCHLEHWHYYGENLDKLGKECHIDLSSVPEKNLFVIHDNNHKGIMPIIINQNEKGIDTENRIEKLSRYIELILDYEEKEQDISLEQYIKNNYQE